VVKRVLLSGLLIVALAGCASADESAAPASAATPGATTETPASTSATLEPAATETPAAASPPADETPAPTPAPTGAPTSAPTPAPISLKGSGSRNTKPFTMRAPARVDLTYSGSGNFIASIERVGGTVLDSVSLSNTIGKTKLRTYVYDLELDAVKSYVDVLAGTGSWTIKITPGVPSPLSAPASFSDKWGLNTRLISLSGDYTVMFSHAGSGNFIVSLMLDGGSILDSQSAANEIGKVKDSAEIYGLDGDYYFDVVADGAWTISIKRQS
jgi:hypothetical protein